MSRILLLLISFMAVSITLSFAQSQPTLGRATRFSVLANTKIQANGPGKSTVYGSLGTSPGRSIGDDRYILQTTGRKEIANQVAEEGMRDANLAYEALRNLPVTQVRSSNLGGGNTLNPGVYKIDGDALLSGILQLNGQGDFNSMFVFLIDGNFRSNAGTVQLSAMGASPENVFWVVEGDVNIGAPGFFQGNIISKKSVTIGSNITVIGRAVSLEDAVYLNANILALPNVVDADLSVTKETDATDVSVGAYVTYTITAVNRGPGIAKNVVVSERIPSGLKFIRAESATGQTYYDNIANQWIIGDMELNKPESIKIVFEVTGTGNIRNEVIIIGDNPDPKPDDDEDEAELPELPDLALTKNINSEGPYYVGDVVRYTITVTNKARGAQQNVNVMELLRPSDGLEYVGHTPSEGTTYNPVTGIFNIPTLAGNTSATLIIEAKLVKNGTVRNVATIIDRNDENDKDPDNDEDDEEIIVECRELSIALTSSQSAFCGLQEGLVISATEVIGATYTWALPQGWVITSGDGTNRITVTPNAVGGAQEVKVTVKDQCNEVTESTPITINITGTPEVPAISGETTVCYNTTEGIVLTTPEVAGYTYNWEVSGDLRIEGAANAVQVKVLPLNESLAGGTVKLTVANSCGLSSNSTHTISVTPAAAKPGAITGKTELCEGDEVTYSVAEATNATSYTWTIPTTTGWAIIGESDGNSITVKIGAESGVISVKANNACSSSEESTKDLQVIPVLTVDNFSLEGEATVCQDAGNLVYTATEVAGATYTFAAQGITIVSTNKNKATIKVGAVNGQLTVTVTDACNRTFSLTKDITVTPKVSAASITGEDLVCANSKGNVYTATAYEIPVTYKWTATGDLAIVSGANSRTVEVSTGALGGVLTLEVSNENGCSTTSTTKSVGTFTVPALPAAITGPTNLCEGDIRTFSVPAVQGVTYNWGVPTTGGWEVVSGHGTAEARVKIGAEAGNLSLTVSNTCGTSATSISLPIAVTNKPAVPVIAGERTTACINEKLTFRVESPVAGLTYTWAVPNGWGASTTTGTSIEVTVGQASGNVTVYATNKCGDGVEASMAVAPTLAPAMPGAISNGGNVCVNSTGNVFSIVAVAGATSYEWEVPNGWRIEGATDGTTITATASETGGAVRVRARNGCGASDWSVRNVSITTPPAAVTRITDNSTVCDGLIYTADPVAGATSYTWTVTEGFTIESGQGTQTIRVKASSPTATGRVSVIAYSGACVGSAQYSIEVDAKVVDSQLDFPKAFSPNGDGKNDEWVVKNLEKFPDNELVIFNRWGSEVYKQNNYKNDWQARGLEQGTYFYKARVKLCDGVYKEYTGYVTVFR